MHALPRNMVFSTFLLAVAAGCSGTDILPTSVDSPSAKVLASRLTTSPTITITPNPASVAVGSSVKLSVNVKAHWSSSDTTIAQVAPSGSVSGRKDGIVVITASANGISAIDTVTVGTGVAATTTTTSITNALSTSTTSTSTTSTTTSTTTTSSTGSGLSGVGLFADDFTQYHNTADLMANTSSLIGGTGNYQTVLYNDGANANLVSLDTVVRYNGHATMRYDQPGGVATTPTLHHAFYSVAPLTKMWLRAKIRFSPGYTTTGTLTNSANAYKMLGWGWSGFNGRGSLEISNTNEYEFYWYVFNSTGQTIAGGNVSSAGTISTEWTDGGWYDYILEYEITSDTTAIARAWFQKDGAAPTLRAVTTGAGPVGTIPAVNAVFLGLNFNQVRATTQNQSIWYGQWEVVDGTQHPNPFSIPGF